MHLPDNAIELLNNIARDEGFCNYKLLTESTASHGCHIHSDMRAIEIVGDREISDKRSSCQSLHLLCKIIPSNAQYRRNAQSVLLFKREIFMYTRALPQLIEFARDKQLNDVDRLLTIPKLYGTYADEKCESYALIMENLKVKKFVLWPRHDPFPLDHEMRILERLARLHALSFALKDQRPTVFDEFRNLYDMAEPQIDYGNFGEVLLNCLTQVINVLVDDKHKAIVTMYKRNYRQILRECFAKDVVDKFGVINHGDTWINNFLFQYTDDTHEVANVCLVDWQLSRYSSPAIDVLSLIYATTRQSLRDEHFNELLRFYYAELSTTIRRLGSDPEKLFRFTDLEEELKVAGRFVMILGNLVIQYALAQPTDVRTIDECCDSVENDNNNNSENNNNNNNDEGQLLLKNFEDKNDVRIAAINELVGDLIARGYY